MRVPSELYWRRQWVCWQRRERAGKSTKTPISPKTGRPASCVDPTTWSSYRQARAAMFARALDGIGFVFTREDPFCGVDLDHCFLNGTLSDQAQEIVRSLDSYCEYSPSRTGLHIIVQASLENGPHRKGGVEIYDCSRYFTFTGEQLPSSPFAILNRQAEVLCLQDSLRQPLLRTHSPISNRLHLETSDKAVLERAFRASNGTRFARLWAGDASGYGNDRSRADAALCAMLAFHTNGRPEQMDRLFRASGLYREKWDRRTASSTYGARTIAWALRLFCNEKNLRSSFPNI